MELAALIVGLIALLFSIMALSTVFQMLFGGPRVKIGFSELNGSDGKRLYCEISSIPIEYWALHKIGVRREHAVISARFRICEAGSNRIMLDTAQALLVDIAGRDDGSSIHTTVADHFGAIFTCALHLNDKDRAISVDQLTKTHAVLPPGRYRADVDVNCGGRPVSEWREFTVGASPTYSYWLPRS